MTEIRHNAYCLVAHMSGEACEHGERIEEGGTGTYESDGQALVVDIYPVKADPVVEARARMREFLRQWNMPQRSGHNDEIIGVHFDPEGEMARLMASDLALILGEG